MNTTNSRYKPTRLANRWVITDHNGQIINTSGNHTAINTYADYSTTQAIIDDLGDALDGFNRKAAS